MLVVIVIVVVVALVALYLPGGGSSGNFVNMPHSTGGAGEADIPIGKLNDSEVGAQDLVDEVDGEETDWEEVERRLRGVLEVLNDLPVDQPPAVAKAWLALGIVYRQKLGYEESAREALACAHRLSEGFPSIREEVEKLRDSEPDGGAQEVVGADVEW